MRFFKLLPLHIIDAYGSSLTTHDEQEKESRTLKRKKEKEEKHSVRFFLSSVLTSHEM